MKIFNKIIFLILFTFLSCKESIIDPPHPISSPAKNVVINELFRIDSTKYYSHWWIEIYNPTNNDISISNWKIKFINSNFEISLSDQKTTSVINKGSFIVITNNKNIFDDFWNIAPLTILLDFSKIFPIIKDSDEVQLIDNENKIISILRFGNYKCSGKDPFPNNQSFGSVEEWHSICRYADPFGAFDTGNSKNDFFEETNPIAGYYSQRMKY